MTSIWIDLQGRIGFVYGFICKLWTQAEAGQAEMLIAPITVVVSVVRKRLLYDSLNISEADKKNPATIITKLETFPKGLINETSERHVFNVRVQEDGEIY